MNYGGGYNQFDPYQQQRGLLPPPNNPPSQPGGRSQAGPGSFQFSGGSLSQQRSPPPLLPSRGSQKPTQPGLQQQNSAPISASKPSGPQKPSGKPDAPSGANQKQQNGQQPTRPPPPQLNPSQGPPGGVHLTEEDMDIEDSTPQFGTWLKSSQSATSQTSSSSAMNRPLVPGAVSSSPAGPEKRLSVYLQEAAQSLLPRLPMSSSMTMTDVPDKSEESRRIQERHFIAEQQIFERQMKQQAAGSGTAAPRQQDGALISSSGNDQLRHQFGGNQRPSSISAGANVGRTGGDARPPPPLLPGLEQQPQFFAAERDTDSRYESVTMRTGSSFYGDSERMRPATAESAYGSMYGHDHLSPPLSANPLLGNNTYGQQMQDSHFSFSRSAEPEEARAYGDYRPPTRPGSQNPRDPRSGRSLADAYPEPMVQRSYQQQHSYSGHPSETNDYLSYRNRQDMIGSTARHSSLDESVTSSYPYPPTSSASYLNKEQRPDAQPQYPQPPVTSSSSGQSDDSLMSVLKKIGLDEDIMRQIKNLSEKKDASASSSRDSSQQQQQQQQTLARSSSTNRESQFPPPPPAPVPAPVTSNNMPSSSIAGPSYMSDQQLASKPTFTDTSAGAPKETLLFGVDLKQYLQPLQHQQIDPQFMAQTVASVIGSLPGDVQQQLVNSPHMLEIFKNMIYENVKSTMAVQNVAESVKQFTDTDIAGMSVDRQLKRDKLQLLKSEEDRLMLQQREMIKQMTKSKLLLESNPLLMANMDLLQHVQTAVRELQAEVRLLEKYLGPKASQPVNEELLKKAKESRKQNEKRDRFYKFVDHGEHWCKCCNDVFESLQAFFDHLYSPRHIENYGHHALPQLNKEIEKETASGLAPPDVEPTEVAVRGVEFVVPVTKTFYCVLCRTFANGDGAMEKHVKSAAHYNKLLEYEDDRPYYDQCWELDKAFSYFAKTKVILKSFLASRNGGKAPPADNDNKKSALGSTGSAAAKESKPSTSSSRRSRSRSRGRTRGRSRSRSRSRSKSRSRRERSRSRGRANNRRSRSRSPARDGSSRRIPSSRSPDRKKPASARPESVSARSSDNAIVDSSAKAPSSNVGHGNSTGSTGRSNGIQMHLRANNEPKSQTLMKPADAFEDESKAASKSDSSSVTQPSTSSESVSNRSISVTPGGGMVATVSNNNNNAPRLNSNAAYEVLDEITR